ncbi:MAG: penicillin-binding protein 1A [Gammaproteobacteria bacterium]
MSFLRLAVTALFGVMTATLFLAVGIYAYIAPELPSLEALRDIQLQVPLRVYTRDRQLIAEFGEKRRLPVTIDEVPEVMVQAFLAAEDDRFFQHPGVDYQGLLRAGIELVRTGEKRQGGSTITMQVARNYFLTRDKTYLRKLTEILLALKIERELGKREILELYLNKIYLGQRAYGVGAAAQVYYGSTLEALSVAQHAMIAGLPKAPSLYNPVTDPRRALVRRNYILGRMRDLGYIDAASYAQAIAEVDRARVHAAAIEVEAPYVAEMVRAELIRQYGEAIYEQGLQVHTTLSGRHQTAANAALRAGLLDYDRRHGYRGPERQVELPAGADAETAAALLRNERTLGGLQPAIVIEVEAQACRVVLRDGRTLRLDWDGLSWARRYQSANQRGAVPKAAAEVVAVGDLVRVAPDSAPDSEGWRLAQLPAVEGALVSLDPADGAVQALVGGFDFQRSKFNRAVQANRQPGSSFKPFVYSAALELGFTTASVLNDAPVVFDDSSLERAWRPENYSGRFYGPTRLREALVHSRNLVSIRLLQAAGVRPAREHVLRFGLRPESVPAELSMSLGSGTLTPLEITRAYAVFANGGQGVEPYFIERIVDSSGKLLFEAQPLRACRDCAPDQPPVDGAPGPAPRVITAQNAWLMTSMMQDVIRRGTGQKARELGRNDLAGKTGTTNEQRDAWFCGYSPTLVASAWIGFDGLAPLGARETGGNAALPIWMDYMRPALDGVPVAQLPAPEGLVTVRIDPHDGLLAGAGQADAVFEVFREGEVPERTSLGGITSDGLGGSGDGLSEPLF